MPKKKSMIGMICLLILLLGMVTRIIYVTQVQYDYSSHDTEHLSLGRPFIQGHLGYMHHIYSTGTLPDNYYYQYYHPPLFYIVGAGMLHLFEQDGDLTRAFEMIQLLNMLVCCLGTLFAYRILKKLCDAPHFIIPATIFISFCPIFYIIGAEMNSDCFASAFQLMAVWFTIVWTEKQTIPNILKIAVCIICAMLSKTSGGLIAIGIGLCFLYCLVQNRREWKKYLLQFAVFGAVCVPLGLSWVIRQKLRFGLPFTYVPHPKTPCLQLITDTDLWHRIGFPYHCRLTFRKIDFKDPDFFCNIWSLLFYTMNFDEGLILLESDPTADLLFRILYYTSIVLFWVLIAVTARSLFLRSASAVCRFLVPVNAFVLLGMFIRFAFDYPYICTVNARYVPVMFVLLMGGYGLCCRTLSKRKWPTVFVSALIAFQSIAAVCLYMFWPVTTA